MLPEERNLLDDLFRRLRQAETQPRDPEVERVIRDAIQAQPAAPYYMAQAVLVQQQALTAAQQRIEDLERQVHEAQQQRPQSGGGFLGGLFGSNSPPRPAGASGGSPWGRQEVVPPRHGYAPPPAGGPWGQPPGTYQGGHHQGGYPMHGQHRGGGFLAGAAQTAVGVAGGMLAAQAIGSLLSDSPGPFAEAPADPTLASGEQGAPGADVHQADYQEDPGGFDSGDGGDDWV